MKLVCMESIGDLYPGMICTTLNSRIDYSDMWYIEENQQYIYKKRFRLLSFKNYYELLG